MKKTLTSFSMSLFLFFIAGIAVCALISFLGYKEILSHDVSTAVIGGVSIGLFFAFGLFNGWKVKKRGLLLGIALAGTYFLIAALIRVLGNQGWPLMSTLLIVGRALMLIIGSIIGVNLAAKHLK